MGGMALERFVRQVDYTMKDATLCKRPGGNLARKLHEAFGCEWRKHGIFVSGGIRGSPRFAHDGRCGGGGSGLL